MLDAHVIHGRADETAVRDTAGTMSYAQLLHESACIAAGLHHMGVDAGTAVAIDVGAGRHHVTAVLALARLGAVPAPQSQTAEFKLVGTPPVLQAPDTEVVWGCSTRPAAPSRRPRPSVIPTGTSRSCERCTGELLTTLEAGGTVES
ncbi:AMP-binding protein [Aeromicrobium sp. UC242_57]